jgi:DNA-binding response OmpR family regulator
VLTLGSLRIDTRAHRVTVGQRTVALCRREYDLLRHLATDPTRVFQRRELLRDVWGFRFDGGTRTLDSHACRLRRKLAAAGQELVINEWGVGYSLTRPPSPAHA